MKKVLKILILVMIIILIFQINSLYASYKSQLSSVYEYSAGTWCVKVNNKLVKANEPTLLEFYLNDSMAGWNAENTVQGNMKNDANYGRIFPGGDFSIYLIIDPRGTDVALMYDIKIDLTDCKIENLKVTGIENYFALDSGGRLKDSNGNTVYNENQTNIDFENYDSKILNYRAMLPLEKVTNDEMTNCLKITFTWIIDDSKEDIEYDSETMQNTINYMLENNLENDTVSIPIEMTFKQYLGDEIDEQVLQNNV